VYRSIIRGFLSYLYHHRQIIKRDLAPVVVAAPMFAQAKPPTFLRGDEVKKLFDSIDCYSQTGLRTYAMLQLAYTLGLRPVEICQITLDDISFRKAEININMRKCHNPLILPLPEVTIKAIAAYIIGARPQSDLRTLFLSLMPPYGPITPTTVNHHFKVHMQKVNPAATAYWLRHTYAQNLLQAGVSLYEIKELMGHDSIESTRKYLLIHIKLMREVLFDE
jgi:site-specific recombinase XerD